MADQDSTASFHPLKLGFYQHLLIRIEGEEGAGPGVSQHWQWQVAAGRPCPPLAPAAPPGGQWRRSGANAWVTLASTARRLQGDTRISSPFFFCLQKYLRPHFACLQKKRAEMTFLNGFVKHNQSLVQKCGFRSSVRNEGPQDSWKSPIRRED